MNWKTVTIGIFCSLLFVVGYAQSYTVNQYRGELNIKLAGKYDKKIKKCVEALNEVEYDEKQSIEVIEKAETTDSISVNASEYKKAISNLHKVSENYQKVHETLFEVFAENCDISRSRMKDMHHYSSGLLKAKYYEIRAKKGMERARSIREIVLIADKPGWIQYKMSEALELEKLAIRDKGRALNIMQDFPVEYNYGWEDDVSPEEVEAALGDPKINRPPDDLFVQKPVETKDSLIVADTLKESSVVFSVQIAAHTTPLPQSYLNQIYSGNIEVKEKVEEGWFKYTIGEFYNFNDVNELMSTCNVEKAFIVVYQGTKKLTVKEALALIRENQ